MIVTEWIDNCASCEKDIFVTADDPGGRLFDGAGLGAV